MARLFWRSAFRMGLLRQRKYHDQKTMKLLITTILVFALSSCVEKITVQGQYGDYSFTPRKAIVIEESK
jgi:hypothetical protein